MTYPYYPIRTIPPVETKKKRQLPPALKKLNAERKREARERKALLGDDGFKPNRASRIIANQEKRLKLFTERYSTVTSLAVP